MLSRSLLWLCMTTDRNGKSQIHEVNHFAKAHTGLSYNADHTSLTYSPMLQLQTNF